MPSPSNRAAPSPGADNDRRPEVRITGRGLVSALGHHPADFYRGLLAGESGLRAPTLFDPGPVPVETAGEIDFDAREHLGTGRNLRPLDRTARLVVAAADRALDDAGWKAEDPDRPPIGLVLGTMFGSVHTIANFDRRAITAGPAYAKPLEFANSVINAAAGQTAIWHRLEGVNSTITGGTVAGLAALAYATERIRQGFDGVILAGGGEELCFESWSSFYQSGHLATPDDRGPARPFPFAVDRNGFALAEGAALLVIESGEGIRAGDDGGGDDGGGSAWARIVGHGSAFDPSRGRDPVSAVASMERSLRIALADADLDAREIDLLSVSASGLPDGDRHEALALAAVFDERLGALPILAIKSNLGEVLGASGALQALAAIEALGSDRLPGIPGLGRPDPTLPGLGSGAEARSVRWPDDRPARALVHCLGLDGGTQTLILEGPDPNPSASQE